MLKDLSDVIQDCRNKFDSLKYTGDILIEPRFAELLKPVLMEIEDKTIFQINKYSIQLTTEKGLRADLASSLFWYGHTFWTLDKALEDYRKTLNDLKSYLKENNTDGEDILGYLKALPSNKADFSSGVGLKVDSFIRDKLDNESGALFRRFLTDRDWTFKPINVSDQVKGKTLNRTDVFESAFNLAARVIVASSSRLPVIVRAFAKSAQVRDYFSKSLENVSNPLGFECAPIANVTKHDAGRNVIYYGAPGTGKSHSIDEITNDTLNKLKIVTVFHPDTQYSDFVGTLKPAMDGNNAITYKFRPGPFTIALVTAMANPDKHVYLVIEEINRAPAAAVFGELFQLLDRKNGVSKYEIDASDPDMLQHINAELEKSSVLPICKLYIPANLSLLATMNSSDQAVMPLDTAFKRRWSFRYMKIDFDNEAVSKQLFDIMTSDGLYEITWKNFANNVINNLLKELKVPEDRLLGPFFLSEKELQDKDAAEASLTGKLFVYLWDDVLRHKRNGVIFDEAITTFGELYEKFINKKVVFGERAEELIRQYGNKALVGSVEGVGDDA